MIKLINLQRDAWDGFSGNLNEPKNTSETIEGFIKVETLEDEILVKNNCIKSTNGLFYDTYVPSVHIENLRNAVHDGYMQGFKDGLKERRLVRYLTVALLIATFYVFIIQK